MLDQCLLQTNCTAVQQRPQCGPQWSLSPLCMLQPTLHWNRPLWLKEYCTNISMSPLRLGDKIYDFLLGFYHVTVISGPVEVSRWWQWNSLASSYSRDQGPLSTQPRWVSKGFSLMRGPVPELSRKAVLECTTQEMWAHTGLLFYHQLPPKPPKLAMRLQLSQGSIQ